MLIVAGSDSGGGAGVQADLKTVTALGGYASSAVTALTAQNTRGVSGIFAVPAHFVTQQMQAVLTDIGADCIKIGMLNSRDVIEAVADALCAWARGIPVVLDPVMVAKGGHALLAEDAMAALRLRLLPLATLLTPNLPEAAALVAAEESGAQGHVASFPDSEQAVPGQMGSEAAKTGTTRPGPSKSGASGTVKMGPADLVGAGQDTFAFSGEFGELQRLGERLLAMGAGAVLVKGGHTQGSIVRDVLIRRGESPLQWQAARQETRHTHGTGCTLASAVATSLAQGFSLPDAISRAHAFVQEAIRTAPGLGGGHGPLNHGHTVAPFTV